MVETGMKAPKTIQFRSVQGATVRTAASSRAPPCRGARGRLAASQSAASGAK